MENLWAVIKFPDEQDSVAAVPTCWLNGNKCYWPPLSRDKVTKAIKNCTPPDDTWQSHEFLPMRNNVFDSYDTAIKKVEKATEISDLDSQSEISLAEVINERAKKRRVVKKTKLTRFASFEVMEDSSDGASDASHNLPEPPKLNGDKRKIVEKIHEKEKRNLESDDPSTKPTSSVRGVEIIKDVAVTTTRELQRITNPSTSRENENMSEIGTTPELKTISEYLRKIVRKQNVIQGTLTEIAEDVNHLKNKINRNNELENREENRESIFVLLKLPVESQTELDELEQYLSTDAHLKNAVKEISSSGGKDVYDLIYRATGKLVTNGFAAGFSYQGRKMKQKFASLKLNKLLIDSAVKTFTCSEKDAELAVSKWLRRCAERARKENK